MTARQKAKAVASALLAKKGLDVCVLDMGEMNSFTDFLVLATATSERHARTLAEAAEQCAIQRGEPSLGAEGTEIGRWILLDLDDVVVHVFQQEAREHYALERLWGEAEPVQLLHAAGEVA